MLAVPQVTGPRHFLSTALDGPIEAQRPHPIPLLPSAHRFEEVRGDFVGAGILRRARRRCESQEHEDRNQARAIHVAASSRTGSS
jgi:hypothetical protein